MARETAAAMATTVVTTVRSCGERNIAHATASVPASMATTPTAATTVSEAVSERRRISRSTPAPASPVTAAPANAYPAMSRLSRTVSHLPVRSGSPRPTRSG